MTKVQLYIIIIIVSLAGVLWLGLGGTTGSSINLAGSIGDPLELVVIKNNNFNNDFYSELKKIISVEIGPSPQPEKLLSVMEIDSEKFRGVLQRHQNLLFVEKSDTFSIQFKYNVFAENQLVVLLYAPSSEVLSDKGDEILSIVKKIKLIEIKRLVEKFKKHRNKTLSNQIKHHHGFNIDLPKDFFVAHKDSNTTWVRRETPKISQGLLIVNSHSFSKGHFFKLNHALKFGLDTDYFIDRAYDSIDSIISTHISGPVPNSHMILDRAATININRSRQDQDSSYIRFQSLWRMENDFMGGIFQAYFFERGPFIYTYLYAPGEKKAIPLLQLESLVHSMN